MYHNIWDLKKIFIQYNRILSTVWYMDALSCNDVPDWSDRAIFYTIELFFRIQTIDSVLTALWIYEYCNATDGRNIAIRRVRSAAIVHLYLTQQWRCGVVNRPRGPKTTHHPPEASGSFSPWTPHRTGGPSGGRQIANLTWLKRDLCCARAYIKAPSSFGPLSKPLCEKGPRNDLSSRQFR